MLVVVEVVDTVVSSSTIRDFHKNSFWQHHCDGTRKLYTNLETLEPMQFDLKHFTFSQTGSKKKVHDTMPKTPPHSRFREIYLPTYY